MKQRLILLAAMSMFSLTTTAQKIIEITSAAMSYKSFEQAFYSQDMTAAKTTIKKGKEQIDVAYTKYQANNAALKQKDVAKLFYYRGMIYMNYMVVAMMDASLAEEVQTNAEAYGSIIESSLKECIKQDASNEWTDDINAKMDMYRAQSVNMGIQLFNDGKHEEAYQMFEGAAELWDIIGKADTISYYNAALAAKNIKKYDKAIEYFQKCAQLKYEGSTPFVQIINTLRESGAEDAKIIDAIKAARSAYPNDYGLLIEELNYYLSSGNNTEAERNLKIAIDKNPNDHILHFTIGTVYDKLSDFAKAEESYLNAIKIKEDYLDAQYSLGALYVNHSTDLKQKASDEKDRVKYEAAFTKANDMMKKAIAPLERAYSIDPEGQDSKNILSALKSIYVQFEMMEDYNRVKALLEKK
jgi:tetratricopeptide (TPR) repeat protein